MKLKCLCLSLITSLAFVIAGCAHSHDTHRTDTSRDNRYYNPTSQRFESKHEASGLDAGRQWR